MAAMAITPAPSSAGDMLRAWRLRRKLSQLELSLAAHVSSRHLSFVETGRSKPSREMVLHLADQLEIPLRERNALLLAAGYAPVYQERTLNAAELAPVRQALDRFLRAHEPYPAVVLDGHFNILTANDALALLTAGVAAELLAPPANALRATLHPDGMAPRIVNLDEWASHLLHRLQRQAALTGDQELERLHQEISSYPNINPGSAQAPATAPEILVPLRLRTGQSELAFFSTISTFGTAADITLAELTVEAFYPANASTANLLLRDIAPASSGA